MFVNDNASRRVNPTCCIELINRGIISLRLPDNGSMIYHRFDRPFSTWIVLRVCQPSYHKSVITLLRSSLRVASKADSSSGFIHLPLYLP